MFSLVASLAITPSANYKSPRIVQGPELDDSIITNEGNVKDIYNQYKIVGVNNTRKVIFGWSYELLQGYDEAVCFETKKFAVHKSDFGEMTDGNRVFTIADKNTWPQNLQDRLEYTISENKASFTYTLSSEDIDWMTNNPSEYPIAIAPFMSAKKLPENVEAEYYSISYNTNATIDGIEVRNTNSIQNYYSDKKTVEIKEEVAPVASDGTVGTYNADSSKITYLDDNQEAMVKLTLTRPVGVVNSGDNEVNIKVPEGMTYVAGSMTTTSSSGLTVNKTDNATAPKFSFTGLPVGENVVVTHKIKAGASDTPVNYNTNNTLTNVYQKGNKASSINSYVTGNVYSEDEYNTTTSMPLQLNGKYNITFDSKGGNYTPTDQSIKGGELSTKPTNPTKDDNKYGEQVFDKWYYLDEDGNEKAFDFSTPIRSDYDLYAKYKVPDLKVSITTDNKTFKPGQEVKYDVTVSNVGTSISKDGEVTFNIPDGMSVKDLDGGTLSQDGKSIVYKFDPIKDGSNTKFHPVLVVPVTAKDGDTFNASASITSIDGTDIDDPVSSVAVETKISKDTTVQTGDNIMISCFIIMMILSIVGIWTFKKKLD